MSQTLSHLARFSRRFLGSVLGPGKRRQLQRPASFARADSAGVPAVETLEQRRLLTLIYHPGLHWLEINGGVGNDVYTIKSNVKAGGAQTIEVIENGTIYNFKLKTQPINWIDADLGDGFDRLTMESTLTMPLHADGGIGGDVIVGASGNDVIFGNFDGDVINGGAGNDTLDGSAGVDWIAGDTGDDVITGDSDNDVLFGNQGYDYIDGGRDSNDLIFGGTEDDTLHGSEGNDTVYGDEGKDELYGETGEDWLFGGTGEDTLKGNEDADRLWGGADNDLLHGYDGKDTLVGDDGNDSLFGDDAADSLVGMAGDDTLDGGNQDDELYGSDDNDELHGGNGDDLLNGDAGIDNLHGDDNDDTLSGGDDNDVLFGDAGVDELNGDDGGDILSGGSENDILDGGDGVDELNGDGGADDLSGGKAGDLLRGNDGNDSLHGQDGPDSLYGNDGTDSLQGGDGEDGMYGGAGIDTLEGGNGNDRFLNTFTPGFLGFKVWEDDDSERTSDDARVGVSDGTGGDNRFNTWTGGAWTDTEVEQIDIGLAALHHATGNKQLLETNAGNVIELVREGVITAGDDGSTLAWNEGGGTMRFFDTAFNSLKTPEEIVIHEIGHNFDTEYDKNGWRSLSGWTESDTSPGLTFVASSDTSDRWWFDSSAAGFVSSYAQTNPYEDFADSFANYFMNLGGLVFAANYVSGGTDISLISDKQAFFDQFVVDKS